MAARLMATGCGKSLRAFCRGPQIPKRRRRSGDSREWREGKGPARKGYTQEHLREAWWRYLGRKTPTETAKAAGAANGGEAPATDPPIETEAAAGFAAEDADGNAGNGTPKGKGAHNGHGPAKRRTRPSEAKPVGEA